MQRDFNNNVIFEFRKKCTLLSGELWVFAYQFAQITWLLHLASSSSATSCHLEGDHPKWGIFWPSGASPTGDEGNMMYEMSVRPEVWKNILLGNTENIWIFLFAWEAVILCLFATEKWLTTGLKSRKRTATFNILQKEYPEQKQLNVSARVFILIKCIQRKAGKELSACQRIFFSPSQTVLFLGLLF